MNKIIVAKKYELMYRKKSYLYCISHYVDGFLLTDINDIS